MSALTAFALRVSREPLVHFFVIGVALVFADRLPNRQVLEPKLIEMTVEVRGELARAFTDRQGRAPSESELKGLEEQWLEDEVLFREGIALGLDRDDLLIRNHVIEKMRFLLGNTAPSRDPSEAELKSFYAAHEKRYRGSPRYSFDHLEIPSGSRAEAQRRLERLQAGASPTEFGDDYRAYEGRTARNVIAIFGPELSDGLLRGEPGVWRSLEAGSEVHLFRLTQQTSAEPPSFDQLRNDLAVEWKREEQHAASRSKLDSMRKGYTVRRDDS
jgi:hypothetical protein